MLLLDGRESPAGHRPAPGASCRLARLGSPWLRRPVPRRKCHICSGWSKWVSARRTSCKAPSPPEHGNLLVRRWRLAQIVAVQPKRRAVTDGLPALSFRVVFSLPHASSQHDVVNSMSSSAGRCRTTASRRGGTLSAWGAAGWWRAEVLGLPVRRRSPSRSPEPHPVHATQHRQVQALKLQPGTQVGGEVCGRQRIQRRDPPAVWAIEACSRWRRPAGA